MHLDNLNEASEKHGSYHADLAERPPTETKPTRPDHRSPQPEAAE
jgi:hypothetical protein